MLKDGEKAAVLQRDKESYAIVPHFPLGIITPEQLHKVADVAEKYKLPVIKITSASRIAMVGLKEDDIDNAWNDLGIAPGHAVGLCVRSIKACPGTAVCRLGTQDSLGMGMALDKKFHGYKLTNKFKIGISGCVNSCGESAVKDLGLIGKPKGWTVMVGGNAAARPRLADQLITGLNDDEALVTAEKVIEWFKENGKKGERLGRTIDRIGLDELKKAVLK
jgi:NAD(P)H-nitrite reductase large subunit